jgi:tetratricopeptide (TPR) repeat protein
MRVAEMLVLAVVSVPAIGCGSRPEPRYPVASLRLAGDAPFDLAEDQDLELERGELFALPEGAPERTALRRRLADEYARRLASALAHGQHATGVAALRALLSLWSADELRRPAEVGAELARYRPLLGRARGLYARAGRDRETAAALAALILADPGRAATHRAELGDVFAFADELAVAEGGAGAQRARPIEILEYVVDFHPAPWVVDRLAALYLERQSALDSDFRRNGANLAAIRAHGDGVLRTAWGVTRILARGGRIAEAAKAIEGLDGLGDDRELRQRLRRALSDGSSAADWLLLAARFLSSDPEHGDHTAALAIAREAIRRFPTSAEAHLIAAESARRLGHVALAIRHYERGLALDPKHADATSELGRLYLLRISSLALSDRPAAARKLLSGFERFHAVATEALEKPIEPDIADAKAAFGRGLVSLGQLDLARRYLTISIKSRPTLDALESLGTIALKQDRFAEAIEMFERALARPEDDLITRHQQLRLMRLLAEAHDGAGQSTMAESRYRAALAAWSRQMEQPQLPAPLAAEALVEQAKILWRIGQRETALVAFDAAVDSDPNGASSHADVVAFLIVRNQYDRALDAYHRALGSPEIGAYFKVYISLWVLAEARRQGLPPDPLALDFLSSRDGTLWYDDLARYATGRMNLAALRARATTRSRRAELLYYQAVLGTDRRHPDQSRRLLQGVVATEMVLFFEYDMARHWLRQGLTSPAR